MVEHWRLASTTSAGSTANAGTAAGRTPNEGRRKVAVAVAVTDDERPVPWMVTRARRTTVAV
jgi:hypothetical protein